MLQFVIFPLERARRWGMVCSCHRLERMLKQFRPACVRASRRLDEAQRYIRELLDSVGDRRRVSLQDCENTPAVHVEISTVLRCVTGMMKFKFKWLDLIPWLFAACVFAQIAEECTTQLLSVDPETLDTLSYYVLTTLFPCLELMRDGCPMPRQWSVFRARLCNCPLDESPGEGYHRRTHLTKLRAAATKSAMIVASTRFYQCLQICRKFVKYGKRGTATFKFEWRRYKRVLQPKRKNFWRPRRMSHKRFYKKLYNHFGGDDDQFACLAPLVGDAKKTARPDTGINEVLRSQYLQHSMQRDSFYSVDVPGSADAVGDADAAPTVRSFFLCLGVITNQSRPKTVPTINDRLMVKPDKVVLQFI